MEYQGYDITDALSLIPKLQHLLNSFRSSGFSIYHTRQGKEEIDVHLISQEPLLNSPLQVTELTCPPFQVERHIDSRTTAPLD